MSNARLLCAALPLPRFLARVLRMARPLRVALLLGLARVLGCWQPFRRRERRRLLYCRAPGASTVGSGRSSSPSGESGVMSSP